MSIPKSDRTTNRFDYWNSYSSQNTCSSQNTRSDSYKKRDPYRQDDIRVSEVRDLRFQPRDQRTDSRQENNRSSACHGLTTKNYYKQNDLHPEEDLRVSRATSPTFNKGPESESAAAKWRTDAEKFTTTYQSSSSSQNTRNNYSGRTSTHREEGSRSSEARVPRLYHRYERSDTRLDLYPSPAPEKSATKSYSTRSKSP